MNCKKDDVAYITRPPYLGHFVKVLRWSGKGSDRLPDGFPARNNIGGWMVEKANGEFAAPLDFGPDRRMTRFAVIEDRFLRPIRDPGEDAVDETLLWVTVVAHPPCQRWGRFWHGSTRKPHQFTLGDDGGCFEAALHAVQTFGGVIEHPCDSHAWEHFNIPRPARGGGWKSAGRIFGTTKEAWTCCVYQGHYGHFSGKPTWLYVAGIPRHELPELRWGKVEQRLHPVALARHGYAKARRIGMMAMVGGKDKTRIRNATPTEFRDTVLLPIARAARKA